MESSVFRWFLADILQINALYLERITRIDKNISPDILLMIKRNGQKMPTFKPIFPTFS